MNTAPRRVVVAVVALLYSWAPKCATPQSTPASSAATETLLKLVEADCSGYRFSKTQVDTVKKLIAAGADVNAGNFITLMCAVANGRADIVKVLVDSGANVNAKVSLGESALMVASGHDHPDIVKMLLDAGADVNAHSYGRSVLFFGRSADVVKLLLAAGADKYKEERETNNYQTPLIAAAEAGYADAVKALVNAGVDIEARDAKNTYGYYPKDLPYQQLPHVHKTALIAAAETGRANTVKVLLDAGANKEAGDYSHWTALMVAAANGHSDVAKLLIAAGANVNVEALANPAIVTPLFLASCGRHSDIVKLLLEAGANKDLVLPEVARWCDPPPPK